MLQSNGVRKEKFLDLFFEPIIDNYSIATKTKFSLYMLRIDGGKFDYDAMYKELGNASIGYVLSRAAFGKMSNENAHETIKYVKGRFRDAEVNDGEGGELLLYCFLEAHLGAPKILSKMELKTAGNNYINGSDGVHLYKVDEGSYHLIFGESKMIADSTQKGSSFRKAIADAVGSIKKVESEGIVDEVQLINSNISKESFDEDTIEHIKSIIIPSARGLSPKKQNAFGIFVGFEIDISDWNLLEMGTDEFESRIKAEVKQAVEDKYEYIKSQVAEELAGYHFYMYAVPFIKNKHTNIDKVRKRIIEEL